jgi:hypothetical protein
MAVGKESALENFRAEVVGSNPTLSIIINLVEYGFGMSLFLDTCRTKLLAMVFQ